MGSLLSSEFFRIRKRPMTWWMIVILLGIVAAFYVIVYLASSNRATDTSFRPAFIGENGVAVGAQICVILGIVMGAQLVASEYGWGTIRALVSRASSRVALLTAKMSVLVVFTVLIVALTIIGSLVLAYVLSTIQGSGAAIDRDLLRNSALYLGRSSLAVGVYAAMAFLIAVTSRSSAAAIAGALAVNFLESLIFLLLGRASDVFDKVQHWFPAFNVNGLLTLDNSGPNANPPDGFSEPRAYLVLAAWTVVMLIISTIIFRRRDITSS